MNKITLRQAEKVEILTLVDNVVDLLLEDDDIAKRAPRLVGNEFAPPLFAEHGFSALIRVSGNGETHSILLDAGLSETTMLENADRLQVDLAEAEAVVISHGHLDHIRALVPALNRLRHGIPIVIHPDAFHRRIIRLPDGTEFRMPPLDREPLERDGAVIRTETGPSVLGGMILITGEIPRVTEFEYGLPFQYALVGGVEQHDPLTLDDQAVIISIKDKGLVVVSGCAHAGIINTIHYARSLTGLEKVHAVVGGFHLSGPLCEPIIGPTLAAIEEIRPDYIIPTHCTGWKAIHEIARRMPASFIQNSVGTRLVFASPAGA
jgi:7,8-dihydropterin-6-yl-methyl-4-(beta-D-ribofuranosyl)aminobenzene 5'-phosphate synthase